MGEARFMGGRGYLPVGEVTNLHWGQAPFDNAGLAVLDDLIQGLKMLVAQGEDHPARVEVFPPQPHRLLTAGLHLQEEVSA